MGFTVYAYAPTLLASACSASHHCHGNCRIIHTELANLCRDEYYLYVKAYYGLQVKISEGCHFGCCYT